MATVDELATFIAKHISYDGSVSVDGVKCPHCGKMAREEVLHHWIDHKGVLVGNIARFLNLTPRVTSIVDDVIDSAHVSGNSKKDGRKIAEAIWAEVYGS